MIDRYSVACMTDIGFVFTYDIPEICTQISSVAGWPALMGGHALLVILHLHCNFLVIYVFVMLPCDKLFLSVKLAKQTCLTSFSSLFIQYI